MEDYISENCDCGFAGDIAGYLYGEIGASERSSVERHIAECRDCADEIAGLSFARSSVREWNQTDFAPLKTPTFVVPDQQGPSFLASLWGRFAAVGLSAPVAACAVLLMVLGVVFLQRSFEPLPERSSVTTAPAVAEPAETRDLEPTSSPGASNPEVAPATGPFSLPAASRSKQPRQRTLKSERAAAEIRPDKATVPTAEKDRNASPPDRSVAKRKQVVPSLSGYDETDDETLRLEDIFTELDES